MKEKDEILAKTDGGLDIFVHYLGKECLRKKFRSHMREDDKHPSCKLYRNQTLDGRSYYYLHDFGDSRFSGDCFFVASQVLNINPSTDFVHLLKMIDQDMCLGVFDRQTNRKAVRQASPMSGMKSPDEENRQPHGMIAYQAQVKEFSDEELAYWASYGITEDTLDRFQVRSLRSCHFTKADGRQYCIYSTVLTPSYGYFFQEDRGIKVYRPRSENRFLYAGELPSPYIFGLDQLPSRGNMLLITGGEKDVLSLSSHGFSVICFNSETAKIPHLVMDQLVKRFGKIVFVYDVDATGRRESSQRVEELQGHYPVSRIDLPLAGSKQEKDVSDYFLLGGTSDGLKALIQQALNNNK